MPIYPFRRRGKEIDLRRDQATGGSEPARPDWHPSFVSAFRTFDRTPLISCIDLELARATATTKLDLQRKNPCGQNSHRFREFRSHADWSRDGNHVGALRALDER